MVHGFNLLSEVRDKHFKDQQLPVDSSVTQVAAQRGFKNSLSIDLSLHLLFNDLLKLKIKGGCSTFQFWMEVSSTFTHLGIFYIVHFFTGDVKE